MSTETQNAAGGHRPVHQPGMFNFEKFDGARWRGGMNRRTREDAIATATKWSSEDGRRHRVYSPGGELVFDTHAETMKVDVLDAMDMYVAKAKDIAAACPNSTGLRQDVIQAEAARAAVTELIEAVTAYRKGEYHDPETEFSVDYHERRRKEAARVDAALARVGGAA